jgi:hypothetical protein
MSFLSILGNIGKGLIGMGGASPGKIADTVMDRIGQIGGVASGAAKGSEDSRLAEAMMAMQYGNQAQTGARDQFQSDLASALAQFNTGLQGEEARYGSDLSGAQSKFNADLAGSNAQFGAGMQGSQFDREGQSREQKQAILSSLLGNMQDLQLTPGNPNIAAAMGSSSGGARPSALTANKDSLMALLGKEQIKAPTYNAPEAFKAPTPFQAPAPFQAPTPYQAPNLPELKGPDALENILAGLGLGGNILGALGGFKKPGKRVEG